MPLFPEMPIPNGESDILLQRLDQIRVDLTGSTTGVMPGLNAALLQQLGNYVPSEQGITKVAGDIQISLPLTDWEWFGYAVTNPMVLDAGESDTQTLWTVPYAERAYLEFVSIRRLTGDNKLSILFVNYPAGYSEGSASGGYNAGDLSLIAMAPGNLDMWWPDPSALQGVELNAPGPVLMEAGTSVRAIPEGSGVAETTWRVEIRMRRTRVGKMRGPYE